MPKLRKEIREYYNQDKERERLLSSRGQLEKIRIEQILTQFLPKPPAVVIDVGGGTGVYALPLAKKGYTVHLIDPILLHIKHVKALAKTQPQHPLASIRLGDASQIAIEEAQADAVMMFGPLYHLTNKEARCQALQEAYRVLKPGGIVFAAGISRFASLLDGLVQGFITDSEFVHIIQQDLVDGQHRNPTGKHQYFTTTYFHKPNELKHELGESGFTVTQVLAVEGPVWMAADFDRYWENQTLRQQLLTFVETIESESSLLGASAHLLAIGIKA